MVLLILLVLTSGAATALGLMVVGLLETPWPILLSLLGLGLFGLQRVAAHATEDDSSGEAVDVPSGSGSSRQAPPESQDNDSPTFTYRGIKYRASPPAKPSDDGHPTITEGIYRGQPWQRSKADTSKQEPPTSKPPPELKYRGHKVK